VKQTFRSKNMFAFALVWAGFVFINALDLTLRYSGKSTLVAAAVLAAITALVYAVAMRPAAVLEEGGLRVRNPFRTTYLPWTSIDEVSVSHSINVRHGEEMLRLWTPTSTARERAKAQRRGLAPARRGRFRTEPSLTKAEQAAAEAFAGKTHADWVGDQITERVEAAKRRDEQPGPVTTAWAKDAFAVIAVAVVLLIAALVVP
jgi:hypothetical protein